jgi:hypothetical protein
MIFAISGIITLFSATNAHVMNIRPVNHTFGGLPYVDLCKPSGAVCPENFPIFCPMVQNCAATVEACENEQE